MYLSGRPAGLNHGGLILVEFNLAIFPQTVKSCFLHMCTSEENGIANEGHTSSVTGLKHLVRLRSCEKQWTGGALFHENAAVLCENHHE